MFKIYRKFFFKDYLILLFIILTISIWNNSGNISTIFCRITMKKNTTKTKKREQEDRKVQLKGTSNQLVESTIFSHFKQNFENAWDDASKHHMYMYMREYFLGWIPKIVQDHVRKYSKNIRNFKFASNAFMIKESLNKEALLL